MNKMLNVHLDFVFKQIFGTEENKDDVLLNFLNETLQETEKYPVTSLTIENPYLEKDALDDKQSILDIRAKTESGKQVNIEIQVAYDSSIEKRSLYYWAKLYESQLLEGRLYDELKKTITVNIVNFNVFNNDRFHNVFQLRNYHTGESYLDDIEVHFMELKKLDSKPYGMDNRLWKWLTFIKGAPKETWEDLAMDTPGLRKAMDTLEFLSQSKQARALAEAREKALKDEVSRRYAAEQRGREEGREEGKMEVAMSLLKEGDLSISRIAKNTGLSEEEIEKLKRELH